MQTEFIIVIILGMFFHFVDAFFTILIIRKAAKKYKNPEDIEMNFHRYFMKRFGVVKGALISFPIGFIYIAVLLIISTHVDVRLLYFSVWMVVAPAIWNVRIYFDRGTKLIKIEEAQQ